MLQSIGTSSEASFFRIRGWIPSDPAALFAFRFSRIFFTSSVSIKMLVSGLIHMWLVLECRDCVSVFNLCEDIAGEKVIECVNFLCVINCHCAVWHNQVRYSSSAVGFASRIIVECFWVSF